MDWVDGLFRRIHRWEHLGSGTTSLGNTNVGLARQEDGRRLWPHCYYPPLAPEEFEGLERFAGFSLPPDFRELYLRSNGIELFTRQLEVYMWFTPRFSDLSLGTGEVAKLNHEMRAYGAPPHQFYFGRYNDVYNANRRLFLDTRTGGIGQTEHDYSVEPVRTWPSLSRCLLEAFDELEARYDREGRMVDPPPSLPEHWYIDYLVEDDEDEEENG